MRRAFQIRVEIYEPEGDKTLPIVVHLFHGRDEAHADRIHAAHKRADAFLSGCEDHGAMGAVRCFVKTSRRWVTIR